MFNLFKKNSKIICLEGEDGVGKTTWIRNSLKVWDYKKVFYLHLPTNILLDCSNISYDDFDSKLKQVENYKEAVSKMKQNILFESLLVGYNNLANLYNQNKKEALIWVDRSFISNLVYNLDLNKEDLQYKYGVVGDKIQSINDYVGFDLLKKIEYVLFLKNTTKDMSILEQRYFEAFKTLDIIMPSELNGYIENTKSRNPADGLNIKTKSIKWFQFL